MERWRSSELVSGKRSGVAEEVFGTWVWMKEKQRTVEDRDGPRHERGENIIKEEQKERQEISH